MKLKSLGKFIVKSIATLVFLGALSLPFLTGGLKDPNNPLSHTKVTGFDNYVTEVISTETVYSEDTYSSNELIGNIKDFVDVPEGGTPWEVFAETTMHEFQYNEDDDYVYIGVRPEFSDALKKLEGDEIIVQGYIFPLGQEEKQAMFLLGPFPVSCPYHYHATPNMIIEVHAKSPVAFSYDAVNIKGTLELVPKDDEYNVFYRLKDAELVK